MSLGGADDLLRSLPGDAGQAVLDARSESKAPSESTGNQLKAKGSDVAFDDYEPWSNI